MYQTQNGSMIGSMIEPVNSLPVQEMNKKKLPIFAVISEVELVIIIVLVIVMIVLPKGGSDSTAGAGFDVDPNSIGELTDYKEILVEDSEGALQIYADILENDKDMNYSLLGELMNNYSILYGIDTVELTKISVTNAKAGRKKSEDYPYGEMRVIELDADGKCARYEFYTGFEYLHSLIITDGACEAL